MDWKKVIARLKVDADYVMDAAENRGDQFAVVLGGVLGCLADALEAGIEEVEDGQSPTEST